MGYSPWGHKELDTTECLTHTAWAFPSPAPHGLPCKPPSPLLIRQGRILPRERAGILQFNILGWIPAPSLPVWTWTINFLSFLVYKTKKKYLPRVVRWRDVGTEFGTDLWGPRLPPDTPKSELVLREDPGVLWQLSGQFTGLLHSFVHPLLVAGGLTLPAPDLQSHGHACCAW